MPSGEAILIDALLSRLLAYEANMLALSRLIALVNVRTQANFSNPAASGLVAAVT